MILTPTCVGIFDVQQVGCYARLRGAFPPHASQQSHHNSVEMECRRFSLLYILRMHFSSLNTRSDKLSKFEFISIALMNIHVGAQP